MHAAAFPSPRSARAARAAWWVGAHDHHDHADEGPPPRGPGRRGKRGDPMGRPPFGGPFGGGPFGPGFGRRGRSRRGDIRAAILALLGEEPMHGYQIITELESRSQGAWRPSPGSVYPTLQALEDQGLVRSLERDGKKVVELTESGREAAAAVTAGGSMPWDDAAADVGDAHFKFFDLMRQVGAAAVQVGKNGTARQVTEASKVLSDTRRRLYQILAEDDLDGEPTA